MRPVVAVCWKAVELRAGVDPVTGEVRPDPHSLGVSPADEAALEWALRTAEASGAAVRVVTAGGPEADGVLRRAAAAGAGELVRVALEPGSPSGEVARALAPHVAGARLVWCGDVSLDRGSGAVPAFLAAELGVAQALGLLEVEPEADGAGFTALRRLDGGRRERLRVGVPAVASCEGGTARLRRAALRRLLEARREPVRLEPAPPPRRPAPRVVGRAPFRPRARVVPPPPGDRALDRVRALMGGEAPAGRARAVTLRPEEAAEAILEALAAWGELP
ncbi:MAG TPA: mycofactocin-associated electron transfer flavoprotein beta subunit [Acidimicrobiales bacterium]|nr:mycofactocin-associated electron transfer flavoprotein beta subunit [Acidimicrobiales bacterium]